MPDVLQGALDPAVSPSRVLTRHLDRQSPGLLQDAWPAGTPWLVGPFASDQMPVPAQDGVWGDEGRHLVPRLVG